MPSRLALAAPSADRYRSEYCTNATARPALTRSSPTSVPSSRYTVRTSRSYRSRSSLPGERQSNTVVPTGTRSSTLRVASSASGFPTSGALMPKTRTRPSSVSRVSPSMTASTVVATAAAGMAQPVHRSGADVALGWEPDVEESIAAVGDWGADAGEAPTCSGGESRVRQVRRPPPMRSSASVAMATWRRPLLPRSPPAESTGAASAVEYHSSSDPGNARGAEEARLEPPSSCPVLPARGGVQAPSSSNRSGGCSLMRGHDSTSRGSGNRRPQ